MSPRFSVVIPCYERPDLLRRALDSCLRQEFQDFEVLLVDDASKADLQAVADEHRARFDTRGIALTYSKLRVNRGAAAARNAGWRNARGDYVAFLDSDDQWHPAKLRTCGAALDLHRVDALFHAFTSESEAPAEGSRRLDDYRFRLIGYRHGLVRNYSATPCFVVRRDIEERFDESMRYTEDHDLWLRIGRRTQLLQLIGPPLTFIGRPLQEAGGLSEHRHQMRWGEMRMYAKFCRRGAWVFALPALLLWSLSKHVVQEVLRPSRARRRQPGPS